MRDLSIVSDPKPTPVQPPSAGAWIEKKRSSESLGTLMAKLKLASLDVKTSAATVELDATVELVVVGALTPIVVVTCFVVKTSEVTVVATVVSSAITVVENAR